MKDFVVDASIAIKWFVPEIHSEAALSLLEMQEAGAVSFHAPDLLYSETGNILWKKTLKGEILQRDAYFISGEIRKIPKSIYPGEELAEPALKIASKTMRSVYDSTYLCLAIILNSQLITADKRFYNSLSAGPFGSYVTWIEDLKSQDENP